MSYEHYDDPHAVRARLGGYEEAEICRCGLCVAAMVSAPPVLVPAERMLHSTGEYVRTGRWLHGVELLEHLAARRAFEAAMTRWGKTSLEAIRPSRGKAA